jgi:hypothetical protein
VAPDAAKEINPMRRATWFATAAASLLLLCSGDAARGEEIPKEFRPAIQKGLEWLRRNQNSNGSWAGPGGMYAVPMTALGGMAMLAEGSTLREGKYRDNIRKAADWLMARAQTNGLFGNPASRTEGGSYMYGHGFSMLFLSSLVGEEDTERRRRELVRVLENGAKYTRDAQTTRGGWGYTSAKDGSNFDEGSVTITQVQGLRAARNAGIAVPTDAIKDAIKYLTDSTTADGGVQYSLAWGGGGGMGSGRPALTAAAICCGFSAGEYNNDLVKKWFKYCRLHIPIPDGSRRMGHDEYTNYYFAQSVYVLGEDRWAKMFPSDRESDRLTWKKYRKGLFDELVRAQSSDGSWGAGNWTAQGIGQVYVTALYVTIMQLDKAALPIYQR